MGLYMDKDEILRARNLTLEDIPEYFGGERSFTKGGFALCTFTRTLYLITEMTPYHMVVMGLGHLEYSRLLPLRLPGAEERLPVNGVRYMSMTPARRLTRSLDIFAQVPRFFTDGFAMNRRRKSQIAAVVRVNDDSVDLVTLGVFSSGFRGITPPKDRRVYSVKTYAGPGMWLGHNFKDTVISDHWLPMDLK